MFIFGAPRSGTTLLNRVLIEGQDHLCGCEDESELYNKHALGNYSRDTLLADPYFNVFLSAPEIEEMAGRSDNYLDFFAQAIDFYCQKTGATWFIEKSPNHVLWHREIFRDFPDSTWIIIRREPAAVIHSIAFTNKTWFRLAIDKIPVLKKIRFLRYINALSIYYNYHHKLRMIRSYSNTAITIRYEDLVTQPEQVRQALADTLRVDLNTLSPSRPFSSISSEQTPVFHARNIDNYKADMPRWIQNLIRLIFTDQQGFKQIKKLLLIAMLCRPFYALKELMNRMRKQRS